jgi:hypothetical protein
MLKGGEDRSSLKEHDEHRPDGPKSERLAQSQSRRERVANLAAQRRRGWKHAIAKPRRGGPRERPEHSDWSAPLTQSQPACVHLRRSLAHLGLRHRLPTEKNGQKYGWL